MKRLPIILALLLALPTTSLAYTLRQLGHPQAAKHGIGAAMHHRRSRRLLLLEQLAWNQEHRGGSGLRVYRSTEHGLTLRFPASWSTKERAYGTLVSFLSPPDTGDDRVRENINVIAQELPGDHPSLLEYTAGTITVLRLANPALTFLSSKGITLGNHQAYAVTYDEDTVAGPMRFEQVWTIVGQRAYLLTLTATPDTFDHYAPVFETMLETMVIS